MNVPPSDSENIICPIAATITLGVRSANRNLRMYQRTPSIAPGSVSDRIESTMRTVNSAGRMIVLAFSMPARTPLMSTTAHPSVTTAVHAICSTNDLSTNPCSGGRIADASSGRCSTAAPCPMA